MTDSVTIEVHRDGVTGKLQLGIHQTDEYGAGHGYRLAGPKFSGSGETLLTATLGERDAEEIRRYLDAVFPLSPSRVIFTDWASPVWTRQDSSEETGP